MSNQAERQAAAEAELAAIKAETAAEEMAASKARAAAKGWPIETPSGEVMIVEKRATANGVILVAENGDEYEATGNGLLHELVGSTLSEEEIDEVEANGTVPPAASDPDGPLLPGAEGLGEVA